MSAIEEMNWFLKNVAGGRESGLCEWLNEQKETILGLKTEDERERAVHRLIIEYNALHRVNDTTEK
ncbi:MAG TPA: hypothetical protein VII11_08525 [Bacteroidota bacterium]